MTIIIDGTVGANKAVVLDSSGKLPAIDGSLVTTLNATQVTTGSIATARIDTGTTTGKVLVLDGSGNMPAIAAGDMTGVSSATKSASDPTVSTNPSGGLGTKWINTTSGEIFILTDATAGANVWTSTGGTSGNVQPYVFQGSSYGYCAGGYSWNGSIATWEYIDRWSYASTGNATDVGDLAAEYTAGYYRGPHRAGGASSATHGYVLGGSGARDDIEKYQMVASADASKISDLVVAGECAAWSNGTYAYVGGWTDSMHSMVQQLSYATDVCIDNTADLSSAWS